MSSSIKPGLLPAFSPAATQATIEATTEMYPVDYITSIVIEISGYLVALVEQSVLFGRTGTDPYSPSLRTLHSRLHSGHLNPSPIQAHAKEHARIKATLGQRTAKAAAHRPLEDFEDLYYAVLARMQDIHQILNARLGSGFNTITDLVYPDGPSIADLYFSLAQYWDTLNHAAFVKTMDSAVRRSRVKYLRQEILAQVRNDEITQADAEKLLNDLYSPNEYYRIKGLAWVNGWAPSMVAAWLEEKHRMVLGLEREDAESKSRMDRKRAKIRKKIKQPHNEPRSKKEGKRAVDHLHVAGGEVKTWTRVDQQAQGQITKDHENHKDHLCYALEWQLKTQRVSEYSQYLRGMASHDAKYVVQSSAFKNDLRMSSFGSSVQSSGNEDTDLSVSGF